MPLRADTSGTAGLYSAYNQHFNRVSLLWSKVGSRCRHMGGEKKKTPPPSKCVQPLLFSSFKGSEYEETHPAVLLPPTMFAKASVPPFFPPHERISRSPEKVLRVCSVNMPEDL